MPNSTISQRLEQVRRWMQELGIRRFVVPTADPHDSEYMPDHWLCREWLTGFTGSAGVAVVTATEALLYTDSRYWLQAAAQLEGTPFRLVREDCPPHEPDELWYNPLCLPDPFDQWWTDRPALPLSQAWRMPDDVAGQTAADKLRRLTGFLRAEGREALLVSDLSEVAWLLNLRGDDIAYNPFLLAFLMVRTGGRHTLFIHPQQIPGPVADYLGGLGVELAPYEDAPCFLRADRPAAGGAQPWAGPSPVAGWRAVKNPVEQDGFRRAHLQDGVAMVRFLRWLDEADKSALTELDIDRRLTDLRAESPDFVSLSFPTIAAYGPHGAIVHYEATPATASRLAPSGLLLLDSGAHYRTGTTDITRTLSLGTLGEEERRVYTLVLKAHLQLQTCRFPEGTTGLQLDMAVRLPLWLEGLDFGHGTGHGVGHLLGVHEGPHQIRKQRRDCTLQPFRAGFTVTDEPGVYLEGRFGVRTENVLLAVPTGRQSVLGDPMLRFEPLTLCPYDLRPVVPSLLTPNEIQALNDYHATVRRTLLPHLADEADRQWLLKATEAMAAR